MKTNHSIIKLFIGITLLFTFEAANSQSNTPISTLPNKTVCLGEQVLVPITVSSFTGITAVNLHIEYDPAQLSFVSATGNTLLNGMLINAIPVGGSSSLYKLIVVWASSVPKTLANGDTLALLSFTFLSGPASLTFNNTSNYGSDCEFGDATAEPLTDLPTENHYVNSTVMLNYLAANPFATDTLAVCGSSYTLNAGAGFASYAWSTGQSSAEITLSNPGWYSCTVSDGVCYVADSVFVSLIDAQILQNDTTLYPGEGVQLTAQNLANTLPGQTLAYQWTTGATIPSITVSPTQTTTYFCTISNGISSCTDSVTVTIKDLPAAIFYTDTIISCTNTYVLDAGSGYTGYLWSTGASSQTLAVTQSGWYTCTISVGTHTLTDSVYVLIDTQPRYFCELRNDVQTSPTTYEFDIYLLGDNACVPLELASASYGITLNPSIRNGGSITASFVAGSSALNSNQVPTSITFTSSQNCIKISPRSAPPAGSGTLIPITGDGIKVCRVKLTNSVEFASATPDLTWSFTTTPYASKVNVFLNSVNVPLNANTGTHTTHHLLNPSLSTLTPPTMVTISEDTLCSQSGSNITLSAMGGSGTVLKWYSQSCGSGFIGIGNILIIPAPEVSTTYYARWEMASLATICLATSIHITPSVPVDVSLASSDNHLCAGTSVTLTATAVNGGTSPVFSWFKNNQPWAISGAQHTYTPSDNDTIYCVLASSVAGCKSNNPAASNTLIVYVDNPPKPSNVKLYLEGLYSSVSGSMNAVHNETGYQFADTIADELTVQLANTAYPFSIAHTFTGQLMTNGRLDFPTPCWLTGNFYLVIKPRNHIETWSTVPISFSGSTIEYDFTTSDAQAYGQNMKQLAPGIWGLWAGDVWGDGSIDDLDLEEIANAATNFEVGYTNNDLNGDGVVDAFDLILIDNNMGYMIWLVTP